MPEAKVETNLRLISRLIPDPVLVIGPDGTILDINAKGLRKYGFKKPDLLDKNILELNFVPPETKRILGNNLAHRLQDKEIVPYEVKLYTKSGEERYLEANASLAKYNGATLVVTLLRDITERKQTEEALRESEERYRSRLDNMMEGCQIIDFDWRYLYVNKAATTQGRTTKEKLLGHTMMEVYPGIEQTEMFAVLKICMEKRQSADIESELQFPNDEKVWFNFRIQPVKEGIFILCIDVTERKRMEELSTALARSSQIGVYVVQDKKFQFLNPQFLKYVGFSQDELQGINPLSLVHPDDREQVRQNAIRMLKGERSSAYEFQVLTKDGKTKWIQETVTPIAYKGKRATLGSFMDTTEHKRMEERLLRLNYTLLLIRKINQLIAQTDNESELLQRACVELVDGRNYKLAWIGFTTKDSYDVSPVAQAGFEEGYLSSVKITWDDSELGRGSTGTAIKTGHPFVVRDILNDTRFRLWREEALKRGYASKVALPLLVEGKAIGALNVYSGQPDAFDAAEIDLLTELAGDISVGIEKIRGREQRVKAEKALHQSEQMLRLMFNSISDGLTVTDLNSVIIDLNPRTLQIHSFDSRDELLGRSVFELIARHDQERAKANMQKTLEQGSTTNIEYTMVKKDGSEFFGELSASLLRDAPGKAIGFIATTRDITERKKSEEQLKGAYEAIATSMVLTLEARDTYTKDHSDKVKLYCRRIALQIGLSAEKARELERAASFHDIGKIAVPDAILNKPGRLTIPEFTQIQLHPEKSVDLLRMIPNPKDTLLAVRHHHERVDGKGYPDGLAGNNIPLCARILAVADAYDALTSDRSYRKAFSHAEAIETLKAGAGTQWDARVVEAAIKALGR